jgi:tRNA dimethylallyltransferase
MKGEARGARRDRRRSTALVPALDPARASDENAIAPPDASELLVVVGPTATGKTELAVRLAERFGGEIISADSVQIYRHFELGTGKPSADEMARATHHLIDAVDPLEPFDARLYVELADRAIASVRARGKVPIVCGGTFLWVKALVFGLAAAPPSDAAIRTRHQSIADAEGRAALHARLAAIDPRSAARLAPNDLVRVSRALEVFELSGKPMSVWHEEHAFGDARYVPRFIGVARDSSETDRRIAARVSAWLEAGWVDEVRGLLARGYGDARAMSAVGFRQIAEHLAGAIDARDLSEAIVRATRVFARRQRTWLRDQPVTWIRTD